MSKDEIAQQTKLSSRAIDAIERGQFAHLPSGIYARAYVRAYAQAVGLDPERIVNELNEALPPVEVELADLVRARKDRPRGYVRFLAAAVIDAVVVVGLGAVHIFCGAAAAGVDPWEVIKAAPFALSALTVATVLLYVGVLGATGAGTAGARLLHVEFVPRPRAPIDGNELARRLLAYMRCEALALFRWSNLHLEPPSR